MKNTHNHMCVRVSMCLSVSICDTQEAITMGTIIEELGPVVSHFTH